MVEERESLITFEHKRIAGNLAAPLIYKSDIMYVTSKENMIEPLSIDFFGNLGVGFGDGQRRRRLGRDHFLAPEHSRIALDVDENTRSSTTQNSTAHDDKGIFVAKLAKAQSKADGTRVTSRTDDSSNGASAWGVHIGDNTISGTLSSLYKEGEEDHDDNGAAQIVRIGEDQNEGPFAKKQDTLDPNTTAHAIASVGSIREITSETTGKQIHPTKDGCNGSGGFRRLTKFILEVQSGGVIHGQFNTKTARVLKEEHPSVEVKGTRSERSRSGHFGHVSVFLELRVVTLGSVVGDVVNGDTSNECDDGGDDRHSAPSLLRIVIVKDLEKREQGRSHNQLGDTSTKVTPATTKSIRRSNDLFGKHPGRPVLTHDECSSRNTDEETYNGKTSSTVDKANACRRNRSDT
mmetsp:Transcript_14165/g.28549  ORF Transcript_14165/g.28549 Transcript_14165/m.28549 type:complete len:405 (-) Transcript_14165:494-1708(-)